MLAVAKHVDGNTLAKELSVTGEDLGHTANHQGSVILDAMIVLRVWRRRVSHPAFNHRTVLADAMYRIGHLNLALEILSGVLGMEKIIMIMIIIIVEK